MKVFTTRILPERGLQILEKAGIQVTCWKSKRDLTQEELIKKLKKYDGFISIGPNKIDHTFLSNVTHLKAISLMSVGYDNVDVAAAKELQIPIGNTPGVLSQATADTAFLLMQMTSRKAQGMYRRIINGEWNFFEPTAHLGQELQGKTLGIFGLGRIGYEMAKRSKDAFNMNIIYHNRHKNIQAESELGAKKVSFDQLLKKSDIISIHVALTEETRGIFNKNTFAKMKPTAIIVNTARGAVINEKELHIALQKSVIWGAGLDVTHPEPMNPKNPLLKMENVVVLPHIGSATIHTRNEMARLSAENILAGLTGKPLPYPIY